MTSEYKEKLQAYGVNLDSALNRFMDNEQFYERILSKFPMDENFILMERSLNENNISQAFRHAHTLKGLAATLDLTNISDILIPMTEKLRAGESEGIQDLFDQLKIQTNLRPDYRTQSKIIKQTAWIRGLHQINHWLTTNTSWILSGLSTWRTEVSKYRKTP